MRIRHAVLVSCATALRPGRAARRTLAMTFAPEPYEERSVKGRVVVVSGAGDSHRAASVLVGRPLSSRAAAAAATARLAAATVASVDCDDCDRDCDCGAATTIIEVGCCVAAEAR